MRRPTEPVCHHPMKIQGERFCIPCYPRVKAWIRGISIEKFRALKMNTICKRAQRARDAERKKTSAA